MRSRLLLSAAVLAQLLDLYTMSPARELNPIAMDPLGPVAKLLLIPVLTFGSISYGRRWNPVLLVGLAVGLIGAYSNIR